ncbi:PrsW family glutamic-type intramembrane protease [Saxibacter everestensis]|uniref:PrsW family glutamic-type intramembrane protease n=1 Tax=Saxibacter everestensis TaxID=2909229 RepID=A0ABY8QQF5_9MICO|nr:PrsW family glutamic-type intramembrane protease [Brevibacteriaceae bacterium ZFBP1038]
MTSNTPRPPAEQPAVAPPSYGPMPPDRLPQEFGQPPGFPQQPAPQARPAPQQFQPQQLPAQPHGVPPQQYQPQPHFRQAPQHAQPQFQQEPRQVQYSQPRLYAVPVHTQQQFRVHAPMAPQAQAVWTQPVRRTETAKVLAWIGAGLLGLGAVVISALLALALGPASFIGTMIVALVPLSLIICSVLLIDMWHPQPKLALIIAVLWGGVASVVITMVIGVARMVAVAVASGGQYAASDVYSAVIEAPMLEEFAKGLGLLILLLAGRKYFNGPLDGLVYGMLVGAGFAFTENILYFSDSLAQGGVGGLFINAILRGGFGLFGHAMYTSMTGIFLGIAARKTGPLGAIGFFFLGLIPAMLLHALWNGIATFAQDEMAMLLLYCLILFPIFVAWVSVIIVLMRSESKLTRVRLGEYANVGWLTHQEVDMLGTWAGRSQGKKWADRYPGGKQVMKKFIHTAAELAFVRQRLLGGRAKQTVQIEERRLLDQLSADRQQLFARVNAGYLVRV